MSDRKIWVYIEQEDGKAHQVSWELLGAANRLTAELEGSEVEGVLLGHNVAHIAKEVYRYGARRVYLIDDPVLEKYRNLPYAVGASQLVEKYHPEIFLVGATILGRDLAGSIATRVRTGLTADCTELAIDGNKKILAATRPTFGGNLMATILCQTKRPQMATVRPRVLPLPAPLPKANGELITDLLGMKEEDIPVKVVRFITSEVQFNIEYADVIVSGGRGVGGPDGFKLLQELADWLGGVVGASRPVVDAGWLPHEHQVGQTGKTVRPKLYIAAGISGAVQHRVGMSGADFILAINTDPNASIFQIADLAIVGDLYEVIPELIEQVKTARQGLRMPNRLRFDAVVVGGGPAGMAAAITMVRGGLKVILVERGRFAGAKNFFGGVMYTHALADILPDYWERKPPFERPVTEQGFWMLSPDSVVRIMHKSEEYHKEPADSYTALRARMDPWLAQQAVDLGILVVTKTNVTACLMDEKGRVIGICTDRPEGDVYAPVVVIAEGVNNLLTQKLGLINHDLPPQYVALSVKQHIGIPAKDLQARFNLSGPDEGAAIDIFGDATLGLPGLAYLYTDKAGVSIGIGLLLSEFVTHNIKPYEVLARFKQHPVIKPYLVGGEPLEYGAHLIPETGYDGMPKLMADGVMVVGDAAGMVDALHREGTNLAMVAGKLAGETAIEAHKQSDFSGQFLSNYRRRLEETFVLKDLKQYRHMTIFLESTPHFMDTYVNLLNEAALRYFTAHGIAKRDMERDILRLLTKKRSLIGVGQDMLKLLRGMRG